MIVCPGCDAQINRPADASGVVRCFNCGADAHVESHDRDPTPAPSRPAPPSEAAPAPDRAALLSMALAELEAHLRARGATIGHAGILRDGRVQVTIGARGVKVTLAEETLESAILVGFATLDRCVAASRVPKGES